MRHRLLLTLADAGKLRLGQHEPHDDLAVPVELARRHEPEPLVKPGRPTVLRYVAGQQLRRTLGPHELRDLPNDIQAVTAALMPLVDKQLPQEPRPDDLRRLRLHVPAHHHELDRLAARAY